MNSLVIDFSERIPIFDKNNVHLFYIASGQADVAHTVWDMNDSTVKIAKQVIQMTVINYLQSKPDLSYDNYANEIPAINEACIQKLTEQRFEVHSLNINSIVPDEASMAVLKNLEQTKIIEGMSSNDISLKMAEEQQKAMEMLGNSGGIVPAMENPIKDVYPNYCPNCGTKTTGTNFCSNCGYKLR